MRTTWSEQELDVSTVDLPGAARMDVMEQLPCRQVDPEAFFAESPADVEWAKALCGSCPLQEVCLEGALERREPWGVWGGQLFINGVVVARKRPRGRPRKNPLPEQLPVAPAAREGQERAA
ncbi:WhiB family transcriptional regulator [Propionibacteriaceae bacterium Y1685]|uniref:WhiB family transcriptional regulator n=1 Tax=Microlunatus sp. Y1700 TaxID=3418487 RepID=UPI003D55B6E0